jgi:hypothetical protein
MRVSNEEPPVTADHGECFVSRQVEWGGMIGAPVGLPVVSQRDSRKPIGGFST